MRLMWCWYCIRYTFSHTHTLPIGVVTCNIFGSSSLYGCENFFLIHSRFPLHAIERFCCHSFGIAIIIIIISENEKVSYEIQLSADECGVGKQEAS